MGLSNLPPHLLGFGTAIESCRLAPTEKLGICKADISSNHTQWLTVTTTRVTTTVKIIGKSLEDKG